RVDFAPDALDPGHDFTVTTLDIRLPDFQHLINFILGPAVTLHILHVLAHALIKFVGNPRAGVVHVGKSHGGCLREGVVVRRCSSLPRLTAKTHSSQVPGIWPVRVRPWLLHSWP